jgi:ketosteroid isomerase-like protein
MRYSDVAVTVVALLSAACGASENPSAGGTAANDAAVAEVANRLEQYVATIKATDITALADYYAADFISTEPEFKKTGPEVLKFAEEFFKTNELVDLQVTPRERVAHDNATFVYEFGNYTETIKPHDGKSAANLVNGNYAIRWSKTTDAKWKLERFIATTAPADSVQIAPAIAPIAPADGPKLDATAVTTQVTEAMNDFVAKVNAGDPEGLLKFWADDFQLYEPEVQFMSKAAFAPIVRDLFAANTLTMALKTEQVFVHDDGRVAYQLGHYQETVTPKDGKTQSASYHNTFMARWKRAADGRWVCDRIIVTPLPKDTPP